MSDVIKKMNGPCWVFAIILISCVVLEAISFIRLALKYNHKYKLCSREEISSTVRTGMIAVVGPSCSAALVVLALTAALGSGAAFMRVGVIGSASTELIMANLAAETAGITLTSDAMTPNIFTLCLFSMALAAAPNLITCIVGLRPMDKLIISKKQQEKTGAKSGVSFMDELSHIMVAMISVMVSWYIYDKGELTAIIVGVLLSVLIGTLTRKHPALKKLGSWSIPIGMVLGMTCAQLVSTYLA